jgi:hypothetical protein
MTPLRLAPDRYRDCGTLRLCASELALSIAKG